MHPYLTGLMAQAHQEDLRQDAERHRLVAQARAAHPRPGLTLWQTALGQVGEKVRLLAKPAPVAARGSQPVCCPA
jgi:hypothetical protein